MKMRTDRRRLLIALTLAAIVAWPLVSEAGTAVAKAGRGLAAMTTPFLEVPGNIIDTTERDGAVSGWTVGLAKGIGMCVVRPLVGVYELLTAPFPAPANFEPILEPEYPWSYFDEGGAAVADR
jgi:putative exosortase-associated protein (TIGR04073 family)